MGNLIYTIFLYAYQAGFRFVALFNQKARAGIKGRINIFDHIEAALGKQPAARGNIWMHCASLGEFEQGRPLLEAIKKQFPQYTIILTFFSASGYEAMRDYKGADHIFYLPFDGRFNAKKMVATLNPSLVLWVKYEYWFHYLHEIKNRQIPLLLVSGIFRPDQPFFKWYGGIWKKMISCFTHFFLQNEASKDLLSTISNTNHVTVTGDTRFDRVIEIAEKFTAITPVEAFCSNSRVIVAGSTWEDDEAELVHYVRANPAIKFIIAPHEIDAGNLADVKKEFPNSIFYSDWEKIYSIPVNENAIAGETPNVLIIDNVGMLSRLYHYADITYVGGGFGAEGVHNVLEAAVYGKPVIYGPEFEKFAEAIHLVECGGGIVIESALDLEKELSELLENENLLAEKGESARRYVYANKGASNKIIQFIQANRLLIN